MPTATPSAPSRAADIRALVERAKQTGLIRAPGQPVKIDKTGGQPVAAESGLRSVWMDITPELASQWLENNFRNRPVKRDVVLAYARDMLRGTWVATHQGIAFNDRDELIDGQHRLLAILEAKITVRMMVTFGLPAQINGREMTTMDCVDRGATRSVSDQLKIQHGLKHASEIAQTARILGALCWSGRTRRLSVGHTLEIYREFQPAVDHVIARRAAGHGLRQAGVLAGFAFALMARATDQGFGRAAAPIAAMYERLVTGEELRKGTAMAHLRAFLTSDEAKLLGRGTDRGVSELVLQAIWLEGQGQKLDKLELGREGAEHYHAAQAERCRRIELLFRLPER